MSCLLSNNLQLSVWTGHWHDLDCHAQVPDGNTAGRAVEDGHSTTARREARGCTIAGLRDLRKTGRRRHQVAARLGDDSGGEWAVQPACCVGRRRTHLERVLLLRSDLLLSLLCCRQSRACTVSFGGARIATIMFRVAETQTETETEVLGALLAACHPLCVAFVPLH